MTDPHGRSLAVLDPGLLLTVQDPGRRGWAHLGVPRGGWLDPVSATLGNRLVGNDADAAVLECLLGGCAVEVCRALTVAVTGGWCTVTVDGRAAAHSEPLAVRAGARVVLGPVTAGLRVYLAVAGGVAVAPVLGSRATDTLSWTGPPRVAAGDVLPVGPPAGPPPVLTGAVVSRLSGLSGLPDGGATGASACALRVTAGPRSDWYDDVLQALTAGRWRVEPDSDRVALRLAPLDRSGRGADGQGPLRRRSGGPTELPSEGVVLGSVQVPPSGAPIVFLADHPTTGGYPVVAVVVADDLPACAHLRPGAEVSFRPA